MELGLRDKVVVIAGSTGGIGKALTKAFYDEGCKLAISSTKQEKLDALFAELSLDDSRVKGFVCDVTDENSVQAYIQGAVDAFGGIHSVIINPGYEGKWEPIGESTIESYKQVFDVNFFGAMYLMKYGSRELVKNQKGSIVQIASNGSFVGAAGMGAYCGSKHAVLGLAKSVALELGPQGIHVNCICPGGVETPMIHRIEKNTFGDTKSHEEAIEVFGAQYLDKRYCKTEEVANMALYLASDLASHMMGAAIRLDGGMEATSR